MSSADRHNPPPSSDASDAEAASEAAPVSGAPPANLSSTMRTGSAFKSTWRMPSLRPLSADPAQSGVRRLDLPELPSPNSGRTLHDLFSAPPPPATPDSPTRSEPSPRSGVTLTDLPSAPPPGAPRGDWARSITVGPRTADAFEVGRRDRITDPLGGLRLSPADLRPQPAEPAAPASVRPAATPASIRPAATPAAAEPSAPREVAPAFHATTDAAPAAAPRASRRPPAQEAIPGQRSLPWGLITTAVVLIAGLGTFAWWRQTQSRPLPRMNLVLPLVQAPPEAEPIRTSVKVADRTTLEPGETEAAAAATASPRADLPPGVPQTLIESMPPGAEVVLRGAVIANTPARVQLSPYESEYLLRKNGYVPELIRIVPTSPERIQVHLKPASE